MGRCTEKGTERGHLGLCKGHRGHTGYEHKPDNSKTNYCRMPKAKLRILSTFFLPLLLTQNYNK